MFIKKPIAIEARQFNIDNIHEISDWCSGFLEDKLTLVIPTLEGKMTARVGDWIIKGVRGEFYPCREDIFNETYEEIEE